MDREIGEIYEHISGHISPQEFEARVEEKVSLMGELCDRRTADQARDREGHLPRQNSIHLGGP